MSNTNDVIDGNVGTEYDEIDQSTMYFDGVPPKWTYEKLKELYDNGELDGNFDVSTGVKLTDISYSESETSYGNSFTFTRNFEICNGRAEYEINTTYYQNGHSGEYRWIKVRVKRGTLQTMTELPKNEIENLLNKMLDTDSWQRLFGKEYRNYA